MERERQPRIMRRRAPGAVGIESEAHPAGMIDSNAPNGKATPAADEPRRFLELKMNRRISVCLVLVLAGLLLTGLLPVVSTLAAAEGKQPLAQLPYSPSLDLTSMDRTANPCVDFYEYSCGGWVKKNPIPARSRRFIARSRGTRPLPSRHAPVSPGASAWGICM